MAGQDKGQLDQLRERIAAQIAEKLASTAKAKEPVAA